MHTQRTYPRKEYIHDTANYSINSYRVVHHLYDYYISLGGRTGMKYQTAQEEERERKIRRKSGEAYYLLDDVVTAVEEVQECYKDSEDEWWQIQDIIERIKKVQNRIADYT